MLTYISTEVLLGDTFKLHISILLNERVIDGICNGEGGVFLSQESKWEKTSTGSDGPHNSIPTLPTKTYKVNS